jgi:hypothetical protein
MSRLQIVWSNPKPQHRKRRWHTLACEVDRRLYLVEELITRGDRPCWAQAVALEIVRGGRAA